MQKKRVIVSVTNDLTTDQRVDRTCRTLLKAGYDVLLVGRKRLNSKTLASRPYEMHRMRLLFDKGPLFYAEYNFALFFFLLLRNVDLFISNDLDSLPANYLAFRIRRVFTFFHRSAIVHIHDCHEYFRGVPELVGRKNVLRIWKWIEDRIFPRLNHVMAVNQSVADLYHKEYGNKIVIIRNVPIRKQLTHLVDKSIFPAGQDQKVILYQGAVNVDRGLEEAIMAMKHLKTNAVLVIAGIGDIFGLLGKMTMEESLSERVIFLGQVPMEHLHEYTQSADLGLSIEKNVSLNYYFCLPNKFLDYIQANVPVLVSPFPEMKSIVDAYQIGEFIESHDAVILAAQLDRLLSDVDKLTRFRKNLLIAAEELCWEKEERVLLELVNFGFENTRTLEQQKIEN